MFLRRTYLVRSAVIICLIVYGVMFAGVLKMNQFPTIEVDLNVDHESQLSLLTGDHSDARPSSLANSPAAVASSSTADGNTRDGPTPAAVAMSLRLPRSTRNEETVIDEETLMKKRLREVDSSIKTASTTTKKPIADAASGPAVKLTEFNGNLTMQRANLSDMFKHV